MDDDKHNKEKLGFLPFILGGLSFIPLCGVPFGVVSIFWGLLSKKRGGKVLAIIGAIGILVTIAIYRGLFYFGFIQRGGVYDTLRYQMAERELSTLVQSLEFYKLQNQVYPPDLDMLASSQPKDSPLFINDPTTMRSNSTPRLFFYQLNQDGSGYYLLGLGPDEMPFTSDDLLPKINTTNTGLLINPASMPKP